MHWLSMSLGSSREGKFKHAGSFLARPCTSCLQNYYHPRLEEWSSNHKTHNERHNRIIVKRDLNAITLQQICKNPLFLSFSWGPAQRRDGGTVFAIPRLDLTMTFIAASLTEIKGIALLKVGGKSGERKVATSEEGIRNAAPLLLAQKVSKICMFGAHRYAIR